MATGAAFPATSATSGDDSAASTIETAEKADESDSDPVEKLTGADFDEYMEQMSAKSDDPYHRINISGANNIRINSIRDLVSRIYLSAPSGITKVFIISEADKMKQEASTLAPLHVSIHSKMARTRWIQNSSMNSYSTDEMSLQN